MKYEIIGGPYTTRVCALRDIPRYGVKAGDVGGRVYDENTLSQEGDCWIGRDVEITDPTSRVWGNAYVGGYLRVEHSFIHGEARVESGSRAYQMWPYIKHSTIGDNAVVKGLVYVERSLINGNALVRFHKHTGWVEYSSIGEFALVLDSVARVKIPGTEIIWPVPDLLEGVIEDFDN